MVKDSQKQRRHSSCCISCLWRGTGGREPGRIGGGRDTGGGKREGEKQDSQSGGNREKRRKILQYFVTFYNRNRTKRWEPLRKGGGGSGSERYGRWEFQTLLSPPTCLDGMLVHMLCNSYAMPFFYNRLLYLRDTGVTSTLFFHLVRI